MEDEGVNVREIKLADSTSAYVIQVRAQRSLGSEYLNQHNIPCLEVLGCNNDVRLVLFNGSVAVVYYTAAYVAKAQQTDQKVTERTLITALQARREKEAAQNLNNDKSASEIVTRRLHSLMWSVGNATELPITLLVYYLLFKDARDSSHEFATLSIPQLVAHLREQPTSGTLVRAGDNGYVVCSRITDWQYRSPKTPPEWYYWRFIQLTSREKKNKNYDKEKYRQSESTTKRKFYDFQPDHPLSSTHLLVYEPHKQYTSVVKPTGGHLREPTTDEEKEEYALTVLALFASGWRERAELKQSHATYWLALQSALATNRICAEAQRILMHMRDYQRCKAEGAVEAAARVAQMHAGSAHTDEADQFQMNPDDEGARAIVNMRVICEYSNSNL